MIINVIHTSHKYSLLCNNITRVESEFPITKVAPESYIYQIWENKDEFRLYHAEKNSFILSNRLFYAIDNYSTKYRTFAAYYHSESKGNRCNFIFEDGQHLEISSITIGEEHDGFRVFQLTECIWNYFDEKKRKFLRSCENAYKRKLGNRFLHFGSYVLNSGKRYLWYYDDTEQNKSMIPYKSNYYKFKNTLSDNFSEIKGTNFFLGINCNRKGNSNIRIYYIYNYHQIDASEEVYKSVQYLPELKKFLVQTNNGWTIIEYDKQQRYFRQSRCNFYSNYPIIKKYDDFIFIKKNNDEWDFFCEDGEYNSYLWDTIKLVEHENIPSLETKNFFSENKRLSISNLKDEFIQLKKRMSIMDSTHLKILIPMKNDYTNPIPLENFMIEFYCFGSATEGENDTLGSLKSHGSTKIVSGDIIAWIYLKGCMLYIVEYKYTHTYRIIKRIPLDHEDLQLFEKNYTTDFNKLHPTCNAGHILPRLRQIFTTNLNICKNTNENNPIHKNIAKIENDEKITVSNKIEPQDSNITKTQTNLVSQVCENYRYLIHYAPEDKVLEAITILYEDRILELYGISINLDIMLNKTFPNTNSEEIVDEAFISEFKSHLSTTHSKQFHVGFEFYTQIEKESLYDSMYSTLKKCNLENTYLGIINDMIDKKRSLLIKRSKTSVINLFKYIIQLGNNTFIESKKRSITNISSIKSSTTQKTNSCEFKIDKIQFRVKLNDLITLSSLKIGFREFINKGSVLLILLPYEKKDELNLSKGVYLIDGEGKNLNENQVFGQNANTKIASGNIRLLIFIKNTDDKTCIFYDEAIYNSYQIIKDPNPRAKRNIIRFKLNSKIRFR